MASYIQTLKKGNDQIIPRTRTDAITTSDGTLLEDAIDAKQNKADNTLTTTAKTVIGAINEHESDISQLSSDKVDKGKLVANGTEYTVAIHTLSVTESGVTTSYTLFGV